MGWIVNALPVTNGALCVYWMHVKWFTIVPVLLPCNHFYLTRRHLWISCLDRSFNSPDKLQSFGSKLSFLNSYIVFSESETRISVCIERLTQCSKDPEKQNESPSRYLGSELQIWRTGRVCFPLRGMLVPSTARRRTQNIFFWLVKIHHCKKDVNKPQIT